MSPGQLMFERHVSRPDFVFGREQGLWGLAPTPTNLAWPRVIIWVQSAARFAATKRVHLNFELTGYPETAPAAFPCHPETGALLPDGEWPTGSEMVGSVFRPNWNRQALYLPCDRLALPGHPEWPVKFPLRLWAADPVITHYLTQVHNVLNPPEE
jgi:hypothetical protein